ncbi:MAG: filamentous hemagglutinin N-terminal protein, partial [Fibrobacteres bacterium]|nr:filamentous hemagglutinin N-terminal protein [Fibrobacterota bacterium]
MAASRFRIEARSPIGRSVGSLPEIPRFSPRLSPLLSYLILPFLLLLLCARPSFAVAKVWDNGGGDNLWNTAANWSPDGVPGSGDDVTFNGTSTANCYYDKVSTTILSLTFTSAYTGRFEWGYAQFGKGIRGQYFSDDAYTGSTFSRLDAQVNFPENWAVSMPSGIGSDNTRTIWHGWVVPLYSQTYTFYETTDDGGRLWVNGTQVINQFVAGGMGTENTGTIALTAGVLTEIIFETYQGTGNSGAELRWSSTSQAKQLIPQSQLYPDHNGLKVQWWQGTDMTGTTGTNAAPFIDYDWGAGSGPDDFFTGDDFSGQFEGFIIPQYTETYTFYATKDDGARLWVNDVSVFDSWTCCADGTGTIDLVAGVPYYIKLEFRDTGSNGLLHFSWSSASLAKQIVPVGRLYLPYWMSVTGNVDLRSGGAINMGAGELQFSGTGAQTFTPRNGTGAGYKLGRLVQTGSGTTTVSTYDVTAAYLEVRAGTFNLGSRSVTPDYFKVTAGTVAFNTGTLNLNQKQIDWNVTTATSGAAGSALVMTNNASYMTTMTGTVTGADIDVTFTGSGDFTMAGGLANGTGNLTKSGAGTLTISGTETQSGPVTVSGGYLTFSRTVGTIYFFSSITNSATVTMIPSALAGMEFDSRIRGAGTYIIDGPGGGGQFENRILWKGSSTGASDNTGPVNIINGGKLWIETTSGYTVIGPASTIDVGASATLSPCGTGTRKIGGLTGSGLVNLSYDDIGTPTLEISNASSNTFSGIIRDDDGDMPVIKSGAGALTLSGANTWTGGYTHTAGTTIISHNTALGAGTTVVNGTGQLLPQSGITVANALTINANDPAAFNGTVQGPAAGTATWSGAITINNTATNGGHFQGGNTTGGLVLSGAITSSVLVSIRNNKVVLSGGGSYANLGIYQGTTYLGATNGICATSGVQLGSVGTSILDLNGFSQTLTYISKGASASTVTNSSGTAATLTMNPTGATTFSGVISGNLALTKIGAFTFNLGGACTYSLATTVTAGTLDINAAGSVIGTQSLILNNGGNVDIDGTVTLSTDATGVFGVGYGATGTSTLTLNTGGALNVGNGGGRTFVGGGPSGGPYGTGILTIAGGTLTVAVGGAFPNDKFYTPGYGGTGTINLNGGTMINGRLVERGSGAGYFYFNGGTFRTSLGGWHLGNFNAVEIRNGGALLDANGFDLGLNNNLAHSTQGGDAATDGGVATTGTSGRLFLTGTGDAWTGPTTIVSGTTLYLNQSEVVPNASAVTINGTLDMEAHNETIGSLAGSGTVDNLAGTGTYTLTTGGDNTGTTFSGIIKNTSGTVALVKNGTGAQVVSGNNTYTGGTTINGGYIRTDHNNGFGTGTVTVNAGAFAMIWAPSAITVPNNWVLNGSSGNSSYPTLCHDGGAGAVVLNGNISVTAASEIGLGGATSNSMTLNGVISGSGNITVDEANGGSQNTLYLAGANTFTGTLTITPGVVRLGANNVIPDGVAVTLSDGGLDLYGHSETIGSLAGTSSAVVDNNAATAGTFTLTTGGNNGTTAFSGVIKNTQQTLALTKTGTGAFTLSGANLYSGVTTVSSGGTLILGSTTALGAVGGNTVVSSGAVLDLNGIAYASAEPLTISGTGISAGGAVKNGSTTAASFPGLVTLAAASSIEAGSGNITLSHAGTISGAFNLTLGGAANGSIASIVGIGTGKIIKEDAGTWTLTGANTFTGGTEIAGGTVSVGAANNLGSPSGTNVVTYTGTGTLAATGSFTLTKAFLLNSGVTGTFDVASSQTLTLNGAISAITTAPVYKSGSGTLILGVDNSQLDNDIFLTGGTLEGRNANAFGNSGTLDFVYASAGTTIRVVSNTALDLNASLEAVGTGVNVVVDRVAAGAGVTHSVHFLNTAGAYTVNVSAGANVTSGTAGFTLRGGGTIAGHSVLDVTDPGTPDILMTWTTGLTGTNFNMTFQGTGNTTVSGIIATGSGTVTKAGSGTLLLSGANTYTGLTTVSAGILQLGHASAALGTSAGGVSVGIGGALDLNGTTYTTAEALTLNGTGISSGGALMNGNAAAATWPGLITLGSASSIIAGTGDITVNNAGTITGATLGLTLGGAQNGTLTSILGTTSGTLTKQDAGTWTISGANTYTGLTTVSAGTLKLNNNAALGTTAAGTTVASGATLDLNAKTIGAEAMSITGTGVGANGALINSSGTAASWAGDVTITANPCNMGGSGDFTLSGATTSNTLTKIGAGTLTLSGTTDNNGMTLVANAGTVILAKTSSGSVHAAGASFLTVGGGTVKVAGTGGDQIFNNVYLTVNSGTLDLNGNSEAFYGVTGSGGTVDNTSGAGTYTLTLVGPGSYSYSGTIQNTSGTLAIACQGGGTHTWSGNNTYSGTTTVAINTTLKVGSATALGAITGGATVSSGGVLDLNGITYTNVEPLTLSGTGIASGGALINSSATGATFPGLLTLGAAASVIAGTGAITLSNAGTITGATFGLTLGGASNGTLASILGTTSGTLTKQDAGTWTLSSANTYTGLTTVSGGILKLASNDALGTAAGATTVATGAALDLNGIAYTTAEPVTLNGTGLASAGALQNSSATGATFAGLLTLGSASSIIAGTGAITLSHTGTVTGATFGLTLGGAQNGSLAGILGTTTGTLTKQDAGAWTLSAANTYTGATTLSAGTLKVNGSLNAGSAVTVASGATLAGTGSVPGTVTVSNGGIVSPGDANEATLSTGAQVLNSTSVLTYTLSPAGSDMIAVTGNFTLDGTVNVTAGTGFTFGTYTLATYTGTLTNNILNVGTLPTGIYATITAGAGVVSLNVLDYSGWNYVSTINFNTTSTGANVPNDVTDFPMLVRLDSNNFIFDQAMPDGRDIRFADPDGSGLIYEIERWDPTLKKAEIWVKVPKVDGNSNRDFINMYWGNSGVSSLSNSSGVFPSASGFGGVWHLNSAFTDASSNGNNGANSNSTDSLGLIGRARSFLAGSSQYVEMPYSASLDLGSFSFSAWTKPASLGNTRAIISSRFGGEYTFDAQWDDLSGGMHADIGNGSSWLSTTANYAFTPVINTWNHVTWTVTTNAYSIYLNGSLVGSGTFAGTPQFMKSGETLRIGQTTLSNYFGGLIDEPRVDNVVRGADWIKLSYETQKANSTALVYANTALSTWAYASKVYVNTSATGANTTSDVTNFPMLVRLTGANFDFSQARTDGGDLRFADSTGALLPYELARYDAANKLAEVWVLLPTVKANNNSQWFRMYWGKPSAVSLSSATSVFQPSNGIAGEYHLNEASGTALDATPNANNGTFNGNVPNQQTGLISKAHLFDGNGDYISAASNSTMDFSASDRVTVSAWVNRSGAAVAGQDEGIASKIEWTASADRSWNLIYKNTSLGFRFGVSTDGTSGNETFASSNYTATNGTWYHVTGVVDGTKVRIYVNGIEQGSTAFTGNIYYSTASPFKIGEVDDDGATNRQYWNGYLDEVSVASVARSADWIKLAYESQKAASTVLTLGARAGDFTKSVRFNFNTTATGANVPGNVTNIPILVPLTAANFDFSGTTATGNDLQFIDKDGTYLYHEVVEWDKANQVGKVWVRVPQVDGNSTADFITLYYGCAACTASPYDVKDSVWAGYNGVWHLDGNEALPVDATRYRASGTFASDQAKVTGLTASSAKYFDGSQDAVQVPNPAGGQLDFGTADFTVSAWVKTTNTGAGSYWPIVIGKENGFPGTRGGYVMSFLTSSQPGQAQFEIFSANVSAGKTSTSTTLNDGNWHLLTGKKTATAIELYVDGVSNGTTAHALGTTTITNDFGIGKRFGNQGYNFKGNIQEAQVAPSALSADFIKLSYENQKATSTLFSTTTITTASFQRSKVFTLNTTASGANIPGDVYNFPLLLRITGTPVGSATPITDLTQSAGQDIRFLDGDGVTWLDYQIERWSPGQDSAEVWVKVPKIEGNSAAHSITMYYQQASATVPDGQCASCVFSTSNGFAGTYHLATDVTSATGSFNGTDNATGDVGGIVGRGRSFNGTTGYISIARPVQDDFTIGFWMNTSTAGAAGGAATSWFDGTGLVDGEVSGFTTDYGVTLIGTSAAFGTGSSDNTIKLASPAMNTGVWKYVTATRNRATGAKVFYIDGAQLGASTGGTASLTAPTTLNIGRLNIASNYYTGNLDEIQISSVVRDSSWNLLTYQNQRRDATPLFNPSPADFQKTKKFTFNTTRTGANVMDSVTNFPLLVRIAGTVGGTPITDLVAGTGTNAPPDIRFLDGDGKTWLNYQVERWDRAASVDSAEVWVLVPKVDGNSDHDFITMYYQQASGVTVADGQCASCVFGTSVGFTGVWHLGEDGNTNAGGYGDASGQGNTGTGTSMTNASDVGGMIGLGQNLDGSTQYITVAGSAFPTNTASRTLCGWAKTSVLNTNKILASYGTNSGNSTYGILGWGNSGGRWGFWGWNANIIGPVADDVNWHQHCASYDGATVIHYIDGAKTDSLAAVLTTTASGFKIGARGSDNLLKWTGVVDEVSLSTVQRSPDWIKLAYQTQRQTGNVFWNARPGPNNTVSLTATAGVNTIALSWNTPVSDSANADSVGLWVKYSGYPDSANAASTTRVVKLIKTDSSYSYPATYPGTYYFALAVRNTNGVWSPFTKASSDTANLSGSVYMLDTVYVDSAIGNNLNSCVQARNPATPMKNAWTAMLCGSGATDTLVVRMMPGTYTDSDFTITSKPTIITSFDRNSRAVLNGSTTGTEGFAGSTVVLKSDVLLRSMDMKPAVNDYNGIYLWSTAVRVRIEGCRIHNNGSIKLHDGIHIRNSTNDQITIANNLILQPLYSGIYTTQDNSFNILNNVIIGTGSTGQHAIYQNFNTGWTDMTVKNNIIQNWDYGILTQAANIGVVASNLFYQVTSGREVTGVTNATGTLIKDPMFADTNLANLNSYKLLPGSPAIDAGSSSYGSGGGFVTYRYSQDYFGNARTLGTAPDIGLYEGTGYTPNPTGDFDTLITVSTSTTVTVKNSKWKIVFDQARGGGINFFSDMADSTTNLLAANTLLFDAKVGSFQASSGSTAITPAFLERTRARAVVRQWVPVSASLNLNIYYAIYASGHIYVQSEISNISGGSTALTSVDYTLKLGTTASAFATSSGKNGFGYLTTTTRDAAIAVTRDLDGGAATAETWTTTSASGSPGTVVFSTANPSASAKFMRRSHGFLIYIGDASLSLQKAATLNADAYVPSVLTASGGSLLLERDWQSALDGHWTLDDGAGAIARDKAVYFQNNATISGAGAAWVSGKVGGGLSLTATDVAVVTDNDALEATLGGTYMFWVKPDFATMGTTAFILSKGITTSDGWYFRKVSGQNQITFNMGAASATTPTLTDGVWTHLCAVVKSTGSKQIELYVNGVMVSASSATATAVVNATDLRFGENAAGGATDRFKGILDDIRIFKNEIGEGDIQAVYARGFSSKSGHYALRADNNNRMVALINGSAAQTRVQPAFQIANWSGIKTPKFVYLNGIRLKPNTDFVTDSVGNQAFGATLVLQLNKVLTGADQTLFVDDDDSTGFMGEAAQMKTLTITATANDKIAIQNFSSTTFGAATSGQWYMELDLNGWITPTSTAGSQAGFGEVNVWKAAAIEPNVAVSTASNLVGYDATNGLHRSLSPMYFDLTGGTNPIFSGAKGYGGTANLTYTLADSSSTRLSLVLSSMSMSGQGTFTLIKRWTFYPSGRIIGSFQVSGVSAAFNLDDPRFGLQVKAGGAPTEAWAAAYATANARWAEIGGDLTTHSIVGGVLSVKNNAGSYTGGANLMASSVTATQSDGSSDSRRAWMALKPALFTQANSTPIPITTNFFLDFSKDFTDSATADSLAADLQNPAVITAITGTRTTTDALDFNADNFAEGDGAYTYAAAGGIAHFKFANTKTSFSPAFRINTWTQGTLPEVVILDNQVLTRGYHYNVYLNTAGAGGGELVMQFNKTLAPGTHVFFINHKTGLAVTLRSFEAKGGEGVDTLEWSTESEFENLGYHLYRRIAPGEAQIDSSLSGGAKVAGAGIANALIDAARSQV